MNGKPTIFISHIHEEAPIGRVLKEWIENAFPGQLGVFLSSDPGDLPIGRKWLDHVHAVLSDSDTSILISIVSAEAIKRPWISIELGAAWIRNLVVMPLCHSGIDENNLPRPLGDFMAKDLSDLDIGASVLDAIAGRLSLKYSSKLPLQDMQRELREAVEGVAIPHRGVDTVFNTASRVEFSSDDIKILSALFEYANQNPQDSYIPEANLAHAIEIRPAIVRLRLKRLEDRQYVIANYSMDGAEWRIGEAGTEILVSSNLVTV